MASRISRRVASRTFSAITSASAAPGASVSPAAILAEYTHSFAPEMCCDIVS